MINPLGYLRNTSEILYDIVYTFLGVMRFFAFASLLQYFFPYRGPEITIFFLAIPVIAFYLADNSLDEFDLISKRKYKLLGTQMAFTK